MVLEKLFGRGVVRHVVDEYRGFHLARLAEVIRCDIDCVGIERVENDLLHVEIAAQRDIGRGVEILAVIVEPVNVAPARVIEHRFDGVDTSGRSRQNMSRSIYLAEFLLGIGNADRRCKAEHLHAVAVRADQHHMPRIVTLVVVHTVAGHQVHRFDVADRAAFLHFEAEHG